MEYLKPTIVVIIIMLCFFPLRWTGVQLYYLMTKLYELISEHNKK